MYLILQFSIAVLSTGGDYEEKILGLSNDMQSFTSYVCFKYNSSSYIADNQTNLSKRAKSVWSNITD